MVSEVTASVKLATSCGDEAERRGQADGDEGELAAGTQQQARLDRGRPAARGTAAPDR